MPLSARRVRRRGRYWIISVSIGRCTPPARRSALQLAPFRRTQAAHDECHTAISFGSMLVAGNTEVTDLLGVTVLNPPRRTLDDTARRASLGAGAGLGPHRHSGPVFGYVLMAERADDVQRFGHVAHPLSFPTHSAGAARQASVACASLRTNHLAGEASLSTTAF
jgi:hypothetical protein